MKKETKKKGLKKSELKSLDELKTLISERVQTRFNSITGKYECRWLERMEDDQPAEVPGATEFTREWHDMTDREENTLWRLVCPKGERRLGDMLSVLYSDASPRINPLRAYISDSLQHVDFEVDTIAELAAHVHVTLPRTADDEGPGEADYLRRCRKEQERFAEHFKRWLVGMVASVWFDEVVNNVVLVLIGEQGTYKSTFFAKLLPPELRQYFMVKTDNTVLNKDDRLQLAKNMLICLEEIDALSVKELNQLKAMITMPVIKDRPAYARNYVNLPRIASLCATGNNECFLNDPTGSRRWLPFLIDHIDDPRTYDINYEKLYSQAFYLAASGTYQYWFTQEEIKEQNEHNKRFETECIEEQLIMKYYAQPTSSDTGVYLTSTEILEKINGGIKKPLSTVKIGRSMKKMGYNLKILNGCKKYHVRELQYTEIQQIKSREVYAEDATVF